MSGYKRGSLDKETNHAKSRGKPVAKESQRMQLTEFFEAQSTPEKP